MAGWEIDSATRNLELAMPYLEIYLAQRGTLDAYTNLLDCYQYSAEAYLYSGRNTEAVGISMMAHKVADSIEKHFGDTVAVMRHEVYGITVAERYAS